jgi:hypothetical protein
LVLGARIGGLAALAVHANLCPGTTAAAVGAVDAGGTLALVVDADDAITETIATEDRLLLATATRGNRAALGATPEVSAGVLFASADEVLTVRAADAAFGAAAALDRSVTAIGQRAAFDRDPEGSEISHHLVTGLGHASGFFRIVTTAVAIPAEVPRRAVGGLAATKETVWDGKVTAPEGDQAKYQSKAEPHQKVPFTEMPVGPMLTSGIASS